MHDVKINPRYERWRWTIFGVTWLAYAGFYLTRKAFSVAKNELKIGHPPADAATAPPPPDRRPSAPVSDASSVEKSAPKTDDPFSGLESLEAEMARLLGRENAP